MTANEGFGSWLHLVSRFFSSLVPVGPRPSSQSWALEQLNPGERSLYLSMNGPDRRHAVAVARRALRLAGSRTRLPRSQPDGFVAAALLHDVGKSAARLGTFGRVLATISVLIVGRERVLGWEEPARSGRLARHGLRLARYIQHDRIGAGLLEQAGSSPLTVAWAREHHMPEQRWTVDEHVARCLKEADGD
jgi:hypothetical protein